jgi:hypothetical protein
VKHIPEFETILSKPEIARYATSCPRCRAPFQEFIDETGKTLQYACGTIVSMEQGILETNCQDKPMDAEMALFEAALCHRIFAGNSNNQYIVCDIEGETKLTPSSSPGFVVEQPVKYLMWDSKVLLSVIDGASKAIGVIPERYGDLNMVWVANRDILFEALNVLGWFINVSDQGITSGQVWGKINMYPSVIWSQTMPWNEPIKYMADAAMYLLYSWMHQPYVGQAEGIKYSRQVKRQAERKGEQLGNINVIEFRKPAGIPLVSPSTDDSSKRELHCCFERTGYSRRQQYGPKNSLRRIQWIAPTLVGDPAKPFKPKGQTLYRVTK